MSSGEKSTWAFRTRFRRHAFGWRSQPAIARIKEAVAEIKKAARNDPLLGGEGAVLWLEKVSPAIEQVDSSSGAIGTAVNSAIEALVPIIANAPADDRLRDDWLNRLWRAVEADFIPYIEIMAGYWGDLCATVQCASRWADEFIDGVRMTWGPKPELQGYYKGTAACLSALLKAGRNEEILQLLQRAPYKFWHYRQWGVKALMAMGKKGEALSFAEDSRGLNTPGEEGKWFAAAKSAGLYGQAIELANQSPCDPRTLIRAARDMVEKEPRFALKAGLAALRWMALGYGYEVTSLDIRQAYVWTVNSASISSMVGNADFSSSGKVRVNSYSETPMGLVIPRKVYSATTFFLS
jgi:hypothetical protein